MQSEADMNAQCDNVITSQRVSRLRLRPGQSVFQISADHLQIVFPNYTVTFTGVPVVKGIRALLPSLEVGAPRDELVRDAALRAELEPGVVQYLVELLDTNGCLYQESIPGPASELGDFYAALGLDPSATLARLSARSPMAVAPDSGVAELRDTLAEAGIHADVIGATAGASCEDILALLAERVRERPPVLLVWNFSYRSSLARLLNDLAVSSDLPVLFGASEGLVGRVGPYVLPRASACLECVNMRWLSNAGEPEARALLAHRAQDRDRIPAAPLRHPLFQGVVVRMLGLELAHILTGAPPKTIGRVIEVQFSDGSTHAHAVLKVPRCLGCHRAMPPRNAWDIRLSAPGTKGGAA